jgi:parallel beta-helix repeat protein
MPISNLPSFTDGQLLTAAQLNQIVTALQTKFSGNVSGSDINWPLVAQGNISLNDAYTLTSMRTLWNVINADEYDSLADAVSALPAGGGAIFIPPNTTIEADGVDIAKPVCIYGAGKTSVLRLTSGSTSGYLLRASAVSNVDLVNLSIDGNSGTGSAQDGVQLRNVDGARVLNVEFDDFSGEALVITNDGTAGQSCRDVVVGDCKFNGGDANHLFVRDVRGLVVANCRFDNPTDDCIYGEPSASGAYLQSVLIANCHGSSCDFGIQLLGASGTASDNWSRIRVIGCDFDTVASSGMRLGTTSKILKSCLVAGNTLSNVTGDAFQALIAGGLITGNYAPGAGGDGIDLTDSTDLSITNNDFHDATSTGIDLTNSTDCTVAYNNLSGAGTALVTTNASGQYISSNIGALAPTVKTAYGSNPDEASASAASGTFSESVTIPAGTVTVGSVIRVRAHAAHSGTADNSTFRVALAGEQAQAVTVNSANDANGDWVFVVKALSGTGSTASSLQGLNSNNGIYVSNATLDVDWTSDVLVDIDWTKANTANGLTLNTFSVEINGG